jgi:hypothetical protein
LAHDFISFHNSVAVLRVISKDENSKLASRARIKPTRKDYQIGSINSKQKENIDDAEFKLES